MLYLLPFFSHYAFYRGILRVTPKPGLYSMRTYAGVYTRIRRLSAQLFILLSPVAPSAYARIRRLSPSKFKHVELSRPAQTSAGISANYESASRSPRAEALFCIGPYAGVYTNTLACLYFYPRRNLRYTVAMHRQPQAWIFAPLPAHTRAWSINPALCAGSLTVVYF